MFVFILLFINDITFPNIFLTIPNYSVGAWKCFYETIKLPKKT